MLSSACRGRNAEEQREYDEAVSQLPDQRQFQELAERSARMRAAQATRKTTGSRPTSTSPSRGYVPMARRVVTVGDVYRQTQRKATPERPRDCPACGNVMQFRRSRGGIFLGCPNYPECKGTRRPTKEPTTEPATTYQRVGGFGLLRLRGVRLQEPDRAGAQLRRGPAHRRLGPRLRYAQRRGDLVLCRLRPRLYRLERLGLRLGPVERRLPRRGQLLTFQASCRCSVSREPACHLPLGRRPSSVSPPGLFARLLGTPGEDLLFLATGTPVIP